VRLYKKFIYTILNINEFYISIFLEIIIIIIVNQIIIIIIVNQIGGKYEKNIK
jgi:hypothetical protein